MKRILYLILTLSLYSNLSAQNYQPVNSTSAKAFLSLNDSIVYSMAFDSVSFNGSDSVYYNYFNVNSDFDSSSCIWWVSQDCRKQNAASWTGSSFIQNSNSITMFNFRNDTLAFDFNIAVNDTDVFYTDSIQQFSIIRNPDDTFTVYSVIDSVHSYTILHTDLSGGVINSNWNGKPMMISKNSGIAVFFRPFNFPVLYAPVRLIANSATQEGVVVFNNEVLYDYAVGDSIQFYHYSSVFNGPASVNFRSYTTYKVLAKAVLSDTIQYTMDRTFFYVDSSWVIHDTVTLSYNRFDTIASIPYEEFDGNYKQLLYDDYCGLSLLTFNSSPETYLGYCAVENCWGFIDTNGPVPQTTKKYVAGLGLYNYYESQTPPGLPYTIQKQITFFKKGNISCGNLIVQNIESVSRNILKVYPVPATDQINIVSPSTISQLSVYTITGSIIAEYSVNDNNYRLNVSGYLPGMFLVKCRMIDGSVAVSKIQIQK